MALLDLIRPAECICEGFKVPEWLAIAAEDCCDCYAPAGHDPDCRAWQVVVHNDIFLHYPACPRGRQLYTQSLSWRERIASWYWLQIHRRIRTSKSFGHFFKWYLGDGDWCWWCKLCRNLPIAQKVIPYSSNGVVFCRNEDCGVNYLESLDPNRTQPPQPCPACGKEMY